MSNNIFISFISPFYNVNQYLDDFFQSFLQLRQKIEFEIIVIDDKGEQNANSIISKWSKKLPIKLIKNKKNIGLGRSRNIGLKNISDKTTHIMYIDSDDAIYSPAFLKDISKDKITFFNYYKWNKNNIKYINKNSKFGKNTFFSSTCGITVPRDIANKYHFDNDIRFYEDVFIAKSWMKNEKSLLSQEASFKYRSRKSSISWGNMTSKKYEDFCKQLLKTKNDNIAGSFFVDYEINQRRWVFHKTINSKTLAFIPWKETSWKSKVLGFVGGNIVRFLGLRNLIYKKNNSKVSFD